MRRQTVDSGLRGDVATGALRLRSVMLHVATDARLSRQPHPATMTVEATHLAMSTMVEDQIPDTRLRPHRERQGRRN